ncbi:endonuclease/exonuclease/phosphatase family protein (plasmid) [Photobacterium sp. GJ3]|uniref:endonuclease/exonuclease/phosphatase family protein n=1 Tax=Photobacterium sp. GJ3 TaxID=2829502 RepID=UPI001B8C00D9|nr:endonuclease/exonuclease/phosphatase family protein [Photobacterium sp. GJ3]QUJ70060.1 endonuclease/exonuclease/phosphatase family protein [Photobacterium sp. GJ3]
MQGWRLQTGGMAALLTAALGLFSLSPLAAQSPPSGIPAQSFLTIMTWNMAWFGTANQPRTTMDKAYIAKLLTEVSPDVLAFQEVDRAEALLEVLPESQYRIYLSDRHHRKQETFRDGNQYTGFAVKTHLRVEDPNDLAELNVRRAPKPAQQPKRGRLRYGAYIVVYPETGKPLHLLNIHLKSGCYSARIKSQSASCRVLAYQGDVLRTWIDQRVSQQESFLIGGDFNHRMADPDSRFSHTLTGSSVRLLTKTLQGSCYVRLNRPGKKASYRHYTRLIDHFLASADLAAGVTPEHLHQLKFSQEAVRRLTLSDHCPIVLRLPLHTTET